MSADARPQVTAELSTTTIPDRTSLTTAPQLVLDPARVAAVVATGLLDSVASEVFDQLTRLASTLLDVPMAFLSVADDTRSFRFSVAGEGADAERNSPIEESFCQYVIADVSPVLVADASTDPVLAANPSIDALGVRGCAGYPVLDGSGHVVGSFCVLDTRPRAWTPEETNVLEVLAGAASAHVALISLMRSEQAAREQAAAAGEKQAAAQQRLSRLAAVTLEFNGAQTQADLTRIIAEQGLPAIGADGGGVLVRRPGTQSLQVTMTQAFSDDVEKHYREIPLDSPLPGAVSARTGQIILLPTFAAATAFAEEMAGAGTMTGRSAWACVPLQLGERLLGALTASWDEEHEASPEELHLLTMLAGQCAQALDRLQRRESEQRAVAASQRLSETLQRSLLTKPSSPDDLRIAVRYAPAAHEAQVGGDWYDAFVTAGGSLLVAIGDVSGHDRAAAAAMGQVRNLVRGMAYDSDDSPAVLLARLDAALLGLELHTLATAVLARVEASPADRQRGVRWLRWSNAGHLPPMLRRPDGEVEVLERDSNLMLGIDARTERNEHVIELPQGTTVLLYTDGLVERRTVPLVASINELASLFAEVGGGDPEDVCDALLTTLASGAHDDDVALLVLRLD